MPRTQPLAKEDQTVAGVHPMPPAISPPEPAQASILSSCSPFPRTLVSGVPPAHASGDAPIDDAPRYRAGAIIAGRYRLLRPLGRGGMGEVWSALHTTLNTEVAVKFLSLDAGGTAAKIGLERFHFEAQVSAQLGQRTTHVVAVHDAGRDDAGPYLVMDYVRGRTLRAELNSTGPLAPEAVADLLDQVAEALGVAHAHGIVHRDLKPSNILLVDLPGGKIFVKVADFGIAKAVRDDLAIDRPEETREGRLVGSPSYMSPEQMEGRCVDARSDLWALGVIVYEALTGRLPFPGRTITELAINSTAGRFEHPTSLVPSLPPGVDDFCARALAKRKAQRFVTVDEMARAFRRAIALRSRRLPRIVHGVGLSLGLFGAVLALRPMPSAEALESARSGAAEALTRAVDRASPILVMSATPLPPATTQPPARSPEPPVTPPARPAPPATSRRQLDAPAIRPPAPAPPAVAKKALDDVF